MTNKMKEVKIEKLTLNIGAGKDQANLNKAIFVIKNITGMNPVKTITTKRIAGWGLRPGLPIGCKLTLRNDKIVTLLKRLLNSKDNILRVKCFDNNGNISFGIPEYIDIPGTTYDPKIGVLGLQVSLTLGRAGFRVKRRKLNTSKIGKAHKISREEAIKFMKTNYNIKLQEEIDMEDEE